MEQSLSQWLTALASPEPTPGGGAAAALMIASGAALLEMVCRLTIGREKFRDVEELMQGAASQAALLRAQAEDLRIQDEAAYGAVAAAYRLPRGSAEEKAARSAEIQRTLLQATETPLQAITTAVAVLELAVVVAGSANPTVIGDAGTAALAARAGAESSALNVRSNLGALKDLVYVERRRADLSTLLSRAEVASLGALSAVQARMGI